MASKINGMIRHVDGVDMRFVGFVADCCRVLTGRRSRTGNPRLRAKISESTLKRNKSEASIIQYIF